jgi:capsule polysaccharide export protein KpsE/RkpR
MEPIPKKTADQSPKAFLVIVVVVIAVYFAQYICTHYQSQSVKEETEPYQKAYQNNGRMRPTDHKDHCHKQREHSIDRPDTPPFVRIE